MRGGVLTHETVALLAPTKKSQRYEVLEEVTQFVDEVDAKGCYFVPSHMPTPGIGNTTCEVCGNQFDVLLGTADVTCNACMSELRVDGKKLPCPSQSRSGPRGVDPETLHTVTPRQQKQMERGMPVVTSYAHSSSSDGDSNSSDEEAVLLVTPDSPPPADPVCVLVVGSSDREHDSTHDHLHVYYQTTISEHYSVSPQTVHFTAFRMFKAPCPEQEGTWPQSLNLPEGQKFNVIIFSGCNVGQFMFGCHDLLKPHAKANLTRFRELLVPYVGQPSSVGFVEGTTWRHGMADKLGYSLDHHVLCDYGSVGALMHPEVYVHHHLPALVPDTLRITVSMILKQFTPTTSGLLMWTPAWTGGGRPSMGGKVPCTSVVPAEPNVASVTATAPRERSKKASVSSSVEHLPHTGQHKCFMNEQALTAEDQRSRLLEIDTSRHIVYSGTLARQIVVISACFEDDNVRTALGGIDALCNFSQSVGLVSCFQSCQSRVLGMLRNEVMLFLHCDTVQAAASMREQLRAERVIDFQECCEGFSVVWRMLDVFLKRLLDAIFDCEGCISYDACAALSQAPALSDLVGCLTTEPSLKTVDTSDATELSLHARFERLRHAQTLVAASGNMLYPLLRLHDSLITTDSQLYNNNAGAVKEFAAGTFFSLVVGHRMRTLSGFLTARDSTLGAWIRDEYGSDIPDYVYRNSTCYASTAALLAGVVAIAHFAFEGSDSTSWKSRLEELQEA